MDDEIEDIRRKKKLEMLDRLGKRDKPEEKTEAPDKPIELDDGSMDGAIQSYPLLVVDCWAPWCAPCRMIAPVVEQLAKKYKGRIAFGKLNVDYCQRTAARFQIMSIPALLVFKNGNHIDTIIGAMGAGPLEQRLVRYL